tara:strand:+ start:5676 stop:7664 length:1989 start_codon:yes stop_codon:yes gene_type:complete
MAINAEQLNIILSARDKEFTKAMDRNQKRIERFANGSNKSLGKTSKAFGNLTRSIAALIPALSAGALIASVKQVTSKLDDIGKTADQIGITTDALQLLRATAESAGVTQDELDKSVEKLGKGLAEAAMGIGTAKDALKSLNLDASDLIGLGLDGAMGSIADEINKISSPMEKTAIAMQLFGRSGAPMINLLREGSAGMAQMQKEARALGIVIDEDLIRNAEEAQTQIDLMSRVINANLSSALVDLAPLLTKTAEGFARIAAGAGSLFSKIREIREIGLGEAAGTDAFVDSLIEQAEAAGTLQSQIEAVRDAKANMGLDLESGVAGEITGVIEYTDAVENLKQALKQADPSIQSNIAAEELAKVVQQSDLALASALIQNEALKEQNRLRSIGAEAAERERIASEKAALMSKILSPFSGQMIGGEAQTAKEEAIRLGEEYEKAAIAASLILNPLKAAVVVTDEITTEAERAREAYEAMINRMLEASPLLQQLGFDAGQLESTMGMVENSMENAFMSMIDGTASASDAFKSMAGEIIKELFRVLVVQKMVGMISGGITSAFGGGTPNPHTRASGGPVSAGQAYVTGEHGRELFVPKTDGRILSGAQTSNAARSGGDGVTIIQNNTFGNGVNRAEVNAMLPKLVQASKAAVLDAKLRGGSYGGAFS